MGKVDARRLWGTLLLFHRFWYGWSSHDPLLFGRTVKTGVQVASPVLLGLLLLDLERIGCRPRVLASARYLPTDLHPPSPPAILKRSPETSSATCKFGAAPPTAVSW